MHDGNNDLMHVIHGILCLVYTGSAGKSMGTRIFYEIFGNLMMNLMHDSGWDIGEIIP